MSPQQTNGMMSLMDAALATHGHATHGDRRFAGVSTDTRTLGAGELFIALRGERFDGHEYVVQALAQGAAAALVESAWVERQAAELPPDSPLLVVADTRLAPRESLVFRYRRNLTAPGLSLRAIVTVYPDHF